MPDSEDDRRRPRRRRLTRRSSHGGVRPNVRVVGVQAASAAAWPAAFEAGHPGTIDSMDTMADGIAVGRAGDVPFAVVQALADGVVTVSEESLSRALLECFAKEKLVVEPAGVAPTAALLDSPDAFEPPGVAVVSGGNIDPLLMLRVLRHGMAETARFLRVKLHLPDVPGALAHLLLELGVHGANVLDVEHVRAAATLDVRRAEVSLQLETRGPSHVEELLAVLEHADYTVIC